MSVSEKYYNFNKRSRSGLKGAAIVEAGPFYWEGYYSCDTSGPTIAYTTDATFNIGTKIYADENLESLYININGNIFIHSGMVYRIDGESNVYEIYEKMSPTADYGICGSSSINTYFYYNGSLQLGTTAYSVCYAAPEYRLFNSTVYVDSDANGTADLIVAFDGNGQVLTITNCGT